MHQLNLTPACGHIAVKTSCMRSYSSKNTFDLFDSLLPLVLFRVRAGGGGGGGGHGDEFTMGQGAWRWLYRLGLVGLVLRFKGFESAVLRKIQSCRCSSRALRPMYSQNTKISTYSPTAQAQVLHPINPKLLILNPKP